jgi:hypothetical protein
MGGLQPPPRRQSGCTRIAGKGQRRIDVERSAQALAVASRTA